MTYSTGKAKSLDDISLNDVLKYPIWEWALDEEGEDDQDETWQRPIISTNNVTDDIFNPTITLKIKDSELYCSAEYDNETQSLSSISIWLDNEWRCLSHTNLNPPITLISIPKINGKDNIQFICDDITSENAKQL